MGSSNKRVRENEQKTLSAEWSVRAAWAAIRVIYLVIVADIRLEANWVCLDFISQPTVLWTEWAHQVLGAAHHAHSRFFFSDLLRNKEEKPLWTRENESASNLKTDTNKPWSPNECSKSAWSEYGNRMQRKQSWLLFIISNDQKKYWIIQY